MGFFKKVSVSAALISAVAVAAAMSASAMTASYDNGKVTLADLGVEAEQKTLLILSEDAADISGDAANTLANGGIIVQIDQDTDFTTVPVGTLPNGTYYVRVGGDEGGFQQTSFTVGNSLYSDPTRLVGDADGNLSVQLNDASCILIHFTKGNLTGDAVQAADANDNGAVQADDQSAVLSYFGNGDTTYGLGTKTLSEKTNYVSAE